MATHTIQIVAYEDKRNGWWSAQCLQYDIAAQAKTLDDLIYEIQRVVMGQFAVSKELGVEPFAGLKPAPPVFWRKYDQAKTQVKREPVPFSGPHAPIHSDFRIAGMCPA
jgi:hypothetical protein